MTTLINLMASLAVNALICYNFIANSNQNNHHIPRNKRIRSHKQNFTLATEATSAATSLSSTASCTDVEFTPPSINILRRAYSGFYVINGRYKRVVKIYHGTWNYVRSTNTSSEPTTRQSRVERDNYKRMERTD